MNGSKSPFPQPEHDHASCVIQALRRAETLCRQRGARLTRLRRRVLELVWNSHEPVGAYAILDLMADGATRPAPITVYRALDFLQAHGLIHRVASLNAFVGCEHPGRGHGSQFLICRGCRAVAEISDARIDRAIEHIVADGGFALTEQRLELEGWCRHCRAARDG
ncbi:MAG: Fur family transcriptional regulator [Gammaproteobacteria bacterium]|nr:Fur family transcriptional regulator [Gammaproteobacteria bacterium]